jgi:hypothetical protein
MDDAGAYYIEENERSGTWSGLGVEKTIRYKSDKQPEIWWKARDQLLRCKRRAAGRNTLALPGCVMMLLS